MANPRQKDKLDFSWIQRNTYMIGDIHHLRKDNEEKYKDVPYFVLGHSMGSFLLRQYLGLYGMSLGAILWWGTGSKSNLLLTCRQSAMSYYCFGKGWEYRSKLVNNMAVYNKKFSQENGRTGCQRESRYSQKYAKIRYGLCLPNAYYQMFCGILAVNHQEKWKEIPKTLPIFCWKTTLLITLERGGKHL